MCDRYPEETPLHHVTHCYPRTMKYLVGVTSATLALALFETISSR